MNYKKPTLNSVGFFLSVLFFFTAEEEHECRFNGGGCHKGGSHDDRRAEAVQQIAGEGSRVC